MNNLRETSGWLNLCKKARTYNSKWYIFFVPVGLALYAAMLFQIFKVVIAGTGINRNSITFYIGAVVFGVTVIISWLFICFFVAVIAILISEMISSEPQVQKRSIGQWLEEEEMIGPMVAIIGIVFAIVSDDICTNIFGMSLIDASIVVSAIFTLYFGLLVWGVAFATGHKRKILSWTIATILMLLMAALQIMCIKIGIIPVPPIGFVAQKELYSVIFGGAAIFASWIAMRRIEPKN